MATARERVTFKNKDGLLLAGRIEKPIEQPKAYAIYAHCFTCSKDISTAVRICTALAERGIAVLRFDFSGIGDSEGDFSDTTFSSDVQDVIAAADFLRNTYEAPQILIGHSLGGTSVLYSYPDIPEIKAVIAINAPSEPKHVSRVLNEVCDEIDFKGEAVVKIGDRPFTFKKEFIEDLNLYPLSRLFEQKNPALLVMHAPSDQTVGIENAAAIFEKASHPKSFISLDNADHLITKREDASYISYVIDGWIERYIDNQQTPQDLPSEGHVVAQESGNGKFRQKMRLGKHYAIADEPKNMGGLDSGPSPYDYLLAGLASCTSMTIRMYADHKGYPLENVTVTLTHENIHATDCKECPTNEGTLESITRIIELKGSLTKEQKESILRIANKCPVHRTLTQKVNIETILK